MQVEYEVQLRYYIITWGIITTPYRTGVHSLFYFMYYITYLLYTFPFPLSSTASASASYLFIIYPLHTYLNTYYYFV